MTTSNYEWFIQNELDNYSGKWIAIDNNRVLESDLKLDRLLKKIKDNYPQSKPFITKITDKLLMLHS